MVSLISELTDSKGRRAERGWVFFDADCQFCTRSARRMRPVLEPRGYGFAALQDPRAAALLNVSPAELLREMRLVTSDGRQYGGANALVYLARQVWWAWPLYALSFVPGMRSLMRAAYRWIADRRSCIAEACDAASRGKSGIAR